MALVRRLVEITVKLGSGTGTNQPNTFTESGTDTVTLSGSRTSVRIENSGTPAGSKASIQIYGLARSIMNQLATLGMVFSLVPRNVVVITAGDAEAGLSTVFSGTVVQAYADYNSSPDVPFHFECISGLAESVIPIPASSYTGATDVATIMGSLATQMGLKLENSGVNVKLSSPYLPGSARTQMQKVARDAGINAEIIDGKTLAIWPKGGSRSGDAVLLSPTTGLIGYPSFTQFGLFLNTLFNPRITFGGLIEVRGAAIAAAAQSKSSGAVVLPADGTWAVYKLDHQLESMVPHGKWQSSISAYNPKFPRPVPKVA